MATAAASVVVGMEVLTPSGNRGHHVGRLGNEALMGSTAANTYVHRARDSGAPGYPDDFPPTYVTWSANSTDAAYTGSPPYGGPLVDHVYWQLD